MYLSEPATTLTDYALGVANLYFAIVLGRSGLPKQTALQLWSIGFYLCAFAAFTGGSYHGFRPWLSDSAVRALWNVTIFSIGASTAFIISAVAISGIRRRDKSARMLLIGILTTLAGFGVQQTSIQMTSWFNHNDIFHVTQIVAMYFVFKAALVIRRDRPLSHEDRRPL
jgi:hypothetical protein